MATIKKKKYIESHWLVFAFQGLVGLLFGWYVMFTGVKDTTSLVAVAGSTLLALGIVDCVNILHRKKANYTWGVNLVLAILELAVALSLLFTLNQEATWHLVTIAAYTLFRGVFEIVLGAKSVTDPTDKFMWTVCGICGCIIAFVIFNSGSNANITTFIKVFGTYMMIYGITNLIYGVHNKNELQEAKEERRKAAEKRKREKAKAEASRGLLGKIFGGSKSSKKKSAKKK